jgi:hypothetical protein
MHIMATLQQAANPTLRRTAQTPTQQEAGVVESFVKALLHGWEALQHTITAFQEAGYAWEWLHHAVEKAIDRVF